jgi:hypothetical protein
VRGRGRGRERERERGKRHLKKNRKCSMGHFSCRYVWCIDEAPEEKKTVQAKEEVVNHKSILTSRSHKELNTLPFGP